MGFPCSVLVTVPTWQLGFFFSIGLLIVRTLDFFKKSALCLNGTLSIFSCENKLSLVRFSPTTQPVASF